MRRIRSCGEGEGKWRCYAGILKGSVELVV